jgi:integration host factor subunit beta
MSHKCLGSLTFFPATCYRPLRLPPTRVETEWKMTKAELIDEVSRLSNLTKKETETIVNTIFDNITDALAQGDKVELRGFGSFRIRQRNSRKGRNPKTGSTVSVPEKRVPFFKVGKRLRELVNT